MPETHHPCLRRITPASGASFWLQAHYPCLRHIIPWPQAHHPCLTWITLTTGTSSQPQVNYRCLRRISLASGELPLPQTHHSGLRRITPTSVARNLTCCCCCCWCRQCWCFWNRQCCCYPFIGVVKLEKPLKNSRDRQTDERTGRQMDRRQVKAILSFHKPNLVSPECIYVPRRRTDTTGRCQIEFHLASWVCWPPFEGGGGGGFFSCFFAYVCIDLIYFHQ